MVKVQARSSNLFTNRAHRNSNHVSSNPSALRDQRVADFMRAHDRIGAQRCKGWLRLEFVFDLLHQGKARVESPVHHLLILPLIGVKPDERVEQALLRFAQTADREFAVEDGEGRLIGTFALLVRPGACGGRRPLSLRRGSWPFAKTLRMQQGRAETLGVSARNQQSNFGGGKRVRSSREEIKGKRLKCYLSITMYKTPSISLIAR